MSTLRRCGLAALAAALPLALTSPELAAQECTASVQPTEVAVGQAASRLNVALSQSIGTVGEFEAAEDSGVRLATPEEVRRVAMVAGGEPPKPIEMANQGNRVILWLNTAEAEPGTYEFNLTGSEGACTGRVTISPRG